MQRRKVVNSKIAETPNEKQEESGIETPVTTPSSNVIKIIYFQPFPKFTSKDQYDRFLRTKKNPNNNTISYFGYSLVIDPKHKPFENYNDDFAELVQVIGYQKQHIKKSFESAGLEVEVEIVFLPQTASEHNKLKAKFQNLDPDKDIILVNAHGNRTEIGISEFSLSPTGIHKNIVNAGLPKRPPLIAVWTCHSGVKSENKDSVNEILQRALLRGKFISPTVIGTTGILNTKFNTVRKKQIGQVTVGVKTKHPDNTETYAPHEDGNFLNVAATPRTKNALQKKQEQRMKRKRRLTMFSLVQEIQQVRQQRAKDEAEMKKVEEPVTPSKPKNESKEKADTRKVNQSTPTKLSSPQPRFIIKKTTKPKINKTSTVPPLSMTLRPRKPNKQ